MDGTVGRIPLTDMHARVYIFENTNNHYSVGIEYALDS